MDLIAAGLNALSAIAQKQTAEIAWMEKHGTPEQQQAYTIQILDMQQPIADLAKGISDLAHLMKSQIDAHNAPKA